MVPFPLARGSLRVVKYRRERILLALCQQNERSSVMNERAPPSLLRVTRSSDDFVNPGPPAARCTLWFALRVRGGGTLRRLWAEMIFGSAREVRRGAGSAGDGSTERRHGKGAHGRRTRG